MQSKLCGVLNEFEVSVWKRAGTTTPMHPEGHESQEEKQSLHLQQD